MVYQLAHSPSNWKVACLNPVRGNQPLLKAKAVHRTTSHFTTWNGPLNRKTFDEVKTFVQWSLWEDKCWVPCADGIKLQSLRSVRFWTSLVRICLTCSRAIELWLAMAIGIASTFGARLDISMSHQLQTNKQLWIEKTSDIWFEMAIHKSLTHGCKNFNLKIVHIWISFHTQTDFYLLELNIKFPKNKMKEG